LAGLMRSLSTKGREGRQLLERQLQKVNGKPFYPRRAAKDREERQLQLQKVNGKTFCPRRAAKDREERQLQLQKVNGNTFYPRRAAKDREERQLQNCNGYTFFHGGHEGPRRTATAG